MHSKTRLIAGSGLMILGLVSNRVVIHLNGGMPFTNNFTNYPFSYGNYVSITDTTQLPLLADIIKVPGGLASIGDALLITGMVILCISASFWLDPLLKRWKKWSQI